MKTEKSKKDLAFDKERVKYRHEISTLQREIKENLREIEVLNRKIHELEESIRQKDDWIQRLLEYTELTEEDMRNQIKKDKSVSEFIDHINNMNILISGYGERFGL
nr:hypothetical protein [uncultured Blautia sp.]